MFQMRQPKGILLTLVMAIGVTPLLAGCGNSSNLALGSGGDGGIDRGLPEGFPSDIPLIDGKVVIGTVSGVGSDKVWDVGIEVSDISSAFNSIKSQLEAAGYYLSRVKGDSAIMTGTFDNYTYRIGVSVVNDETHGLMASYGVSLYASDLSF